jgi:hypothetical protein
LGATSIITLGPYSGWPSTQSNYNSSLSRIFTVEHVNMNDFIDKDEENLLLTRKMRRYDANEGKNDDSDYFDSTCQNGPYYARDNAFSKKQWIFDDTIDHENLKSKRNVLLSYIFITFFMLICGIMVSSQYIFTSSSMAAIPKTITTPRDDSSYTYTTYKFTTSSAVGSYYKLSSFVDTYLTYVNFPLTTLGCNTSMKVIGKTFGDFELHWVDSSVFPQSGKTFTDLSAYVSSLGPYDFNEFMHNKIQLFVPDIQPHYSLISGDGLTNVAYRFSKSSGSDVNDVAHISVFLEDAATVYEIVGPLSSLDADSMTAFLSWSDAECPIAHALSESLEYYTSKYESSLSDDSILTWGSSSGLYPPMKIQMSIPTQSIDYISDTLSLVNAITGAIINYDNSEDGKCSVAKLTQPMDTTTIIYVANTGTGVTLDYSIADWEADAAASHADYAINQDWDRYLDHHIGIEFGLNSTCDSDFSRVTAALETYGNYTYSLRTTGLGTHFYVGTSGIRTWEFNLHECTFDFVYPDVCGCLETNRNDDYYVDGVNGKCESYA